MDLLSRLLLPPLLAIPLVAQQQPAPPSATVTLDVTVTERSGKAVPGLTQSSFTVLDNGSPQQILSFRAAQAPVTDPPLQVILLFDSVNNSILNVGTEREQIAAFLRKSGPKLPYQLAFIFFSDSGTEIQQTATSSTDDLLANLKQQQMKLHTAQRSSGAYGAAERVQYTLQAVAQVAAFEQGVPGRKLLIWISPGWPYLSGPGMTLTAREQRQIFFNIVGLSTALERARITLYNVNPLGAEDAASSNTTFYKEFLKPVPSSQKVAQGNLTLQVLAEHTGGRVVTTGSNLVAQIASCTDDASAFYVLTIPRAPTDSSDTLHSIQVKLSDPKLQARTLFGYYAQP